MKKYLFTFFTFIFSQTLLSQQLIKITDSLLLNSEYEKALTLLSQHSAQKDLSLAHLVENKKVEAYTRLGKFEDAEKILKSLEQQKDKPLSMQAVTKTNLGFLYLNQGRNDLAIESLQLALEYFGKENLTNSLEAAQAMTYLGLTYKSTNKQALAEEQLQMALSIRQHILKGDHELVAASYNDLGFAYAQSNNDLALDYYEKGLAIYKKLHGNDHPKIAIANTNIGFIYRELILYGDAVNNLEAALKTWEKVYPQPHPSKAFVLFNLGKTYMEMGNQKAARGFYDRALEMYKSSYVNKHPEISNVLNAIGALELSAGEYESAIKFCQQALKANVPDFENDNESVNPDLENFYHGNVLLNSLLLKAQCLEARHFGKTLKFSDLELGLKTLQRCDSLIDILRQHSTNESDKIALGVIANEVYADGVRIAHEAGSIALRKKPYLELAFYFAEKSKSAVLLEAISESDAKSFAGIPPNLLEEEKNLKSAITLTAQKLAQKPSPEEEKYLRQTAFTLNRTYESFVKKLENEFPGYYNLKFNAALPSIAQLQQLLDNKTALLSYFTDDKKSRLYIFLITKNIYKIVDHSISKEFDKYITGLRNGLYFNVITAYTEAAEKLHKTLIPSNIPSSVTNLVIIPTGRLSIIPFETLLSKKSKAAHDYSSLPYLLNRFAVRYEFSAGLMLQKTKQSVNKELSIFLCAPVTFPEKDNLTELPATESEVKEISKLFASRNINNTTVTGQEANEHAVKTSKLKNYSLLHFATHGVVDENDPQLSRIFLQNADAEDGNLFAGEIYNLEMNASLVTLSACQTGLGKISKGEGVIGLSRALVYAGAKNIIVSFWSVADESTSELMKNFYKLMLENPSMGYSDSLRQAKLSLLKNGKYTPPYYWAPFILIGF